MNNLGFTLSNFKVIVRVFITLLLPLVSLAQSDDCSAPTPITSSTTCNNTPGTLKGAGATASIAAYCGNAGSADVWYSFTAQSAYPTITLSSMGTNLAASPRLQLFTASCSPLSSLACVSGTNTTTLGLSVASEVGGAGLTIGATYYIRVFTNTTGTAGNTATWNFNICVTDDPLIPPANDACSSAIAITSSANCTTTAGTLVGASYTAIASIGCGVASRNDVWYSFTAQSTNPTISLTTALANPRVQLYSGTCAGGLTSEACGNSSLTATGLTVGATYFIRVYTDPNATGIFTICVTDPPANDFCANAIALNSGATCNNASGTLNAATTFTATANACGTNNDVWYSFVAKVSNPTITLSGAPSDTRGQIMAGTCAGGFTAVGACPSSATTTASGLTVGATYYVRVYSESNTVGTFNICVTDPVPANDDCASAITLTSAITCTPVTGNMYLASTSAATVAPCTGPVVYDLWYRFTAQTTNPTITLGAIGSNINSPRLQLFSGTCAGLTSLFCGTTSIASSGLTIGNTYYVRVYASAGSAPASAANADFNICVTDVPPPAPSNDDCTGAIALPTNANCSRVWGTVAGSTGSGIAVSTGCTGASGYDVWYKFDAIAASTTITTADFGTNFQNRRMQLFSGACGSLTPITCVTTNAINATGLTVGATYYIRLFSADANAPITNGDFSICITTAAANIGPRFGNSYVNISKKSLGGVVQKGDTLEIRMTINHTSGTLYKMRYLDNVPTNTQMLTGASDRISVITNEGIAIQNYTPAASDDAATYLVTPPAGQHQIRMNLGFGTTTAPSPALSVPPDNTETEVASATGEAIASSHIPKGGGGLLFATSFRVVVTGNVGDVITLGAGKFIYRNVSTGGSDIVLTATPYQILISDPMSLCANSTGVNMSQESGGTFGSGSTLNRNQDLTFPIPGYSFVKTSSSQALGDGQYAIVKNMSPRSGTNRDADRSPTNTYAFPDQRSSTYRMHGGHWDIDGDHTGTTDAVGNIPTGDGVSSGYMLMVNADYVASETYRQTLTNLCPNTYYEFSAWFRNICPTCGIDYVTGGNYSPRQPGVLPNLTFALDGLDRYNTGEIAYSNVNSNSGGWVKKGFVFITGPTQTTATLSIRNNSQGGGGNDWAMDDITVATCLPSMTYTPTLNPTVCQFNPITISNTMRSYFSNYTYFKWQSSTDGGTTWADIPSQSGSATPTLVGGQWEYATSYTIPPANTTSANNGDRYRQIVATTATNLNGSTCQATDGVSIISLNVLTDCTPLNTNFLSFNGKLQNSYAQLSWTTSKEEEAFSFGVERSNDGVHFTRVGTVNSYNNARAVNNHYAFADSIALANIAYYRIAMVDAANKTKYSRTIQLGNKTETFSVNVTTNPFDKHLSFNVTVDKYAKVTAVLLDATGNVVKEKTYTASAGINSFSLLDTDDLTSGIYILKVYNQDQLQSIKLMKK